MPFQHQRKWVELLNSLVQILVNYLKKIYIFAIRHCWFFFLKTFSLAFMLLWFIERINVMMPIYNWLLLKCDWKEINVKWCLSFKFRKKYRCLPTETERENKCFSSCFFFHMYKLNNVVSNLVKQAWNNFGPWSKDNSLFTTKFYYGIKTTLKTNWNLFTFWRVDPNISHNYF